MTSLEEIVIYLSVGFIIIFYIIAISVLFSLKKKSYDELIQVEKKGSKDHNELGYVRGIYEVHTSSAYMGLTFLPIVLLIIYILLAKEFKIFPFISTARKCPSGTINTKQEVSPNLDN